MVKMVAVMMDLTTDESNIFYKYDRSESSKFTYNASTLLILLSSQKFLNLTNIIIINHLFPEHVFYKIFGI